MVSCVSQPVATRRTRLATASISLQQAPALVQQFLAGGGELGLARAAVEQQHVERVLELAHAVGQRRGHLAELARRGGKAAGAGDGVHHRQGFGGQHVAAVGHGRSVRQAFILFERMLQGRSDRRRGRGSYIGRHRHHRTRSTTMITLRKSSDRGYADHGWLKSFHSFSFADYHDPTHMGFGNLRVINEDRIAPGTGFGTHGHRDMEIVSYVLEGALGAQGQHGQRPGGRRHAGVIRPGDVQRMSAGTRRAAQRVQPRGRTQTTHFLQIWIQPDAARHRAGLRAEAFRRRRQARPAAPGRRARRARRLGDDPRRRGALRRPVRWRRVARAAARPGAAQPTCTWCAAR